MVEIFYKKSGYNYSFCATRYYFDKDDFYMHSLETIEGEVGMSFEIPTTFAPNFISQVVSQLPLKPVWPVTKTFLFL